MARAKAISRPVASRVRLLATGGTRIFVGLRTGATTLLGLLTLLITGASTPVVDTGSPYGLHDDIGQAPSVPIPPASKSGAAPSPASAPHGDLVWEKPSLPASDLQFPGSGNPTGVLRLTQAQFEVDGTVIDQTTYFRPTVFGKLAWAKDPNDPDKEIAVTTFALVIGGRFVGTRDLQLSHKPKWEAGQGNYTTALHWGTAMPDIRHKTLIGRALRLHTPAGNGAPYVLEIDI